MSLYYKPNPIYEAIKSHLALVELDGKPVKTAMDAVEWVAPQNIIAPVTSPGPMSFTLAGPSWASFQFQVTSVLSERKFARIIGDEVRYVLTGLDRKGQFIHPLEGIRVMALVSKNDGHLRADARNHSWVETYEITYTND